MKAANRAERNRAVGHDVQSTVGAAAGQLGIAVAHVTHPQQGARLGVAQERIAMAGGGPVSLTVTSIPAGWGGRGDERQRGFTPGYRCGTQPPRTSG